MNRHLWRAALLIILLMAQGCASFPGNKLPQVTSFPALGDGEVKKSVSYALTAETDVFGKSSNPLARSIVENELSDVIKESGYFTTWGAGVTGDVAIDVTFLNSGNPATLIPAVITGLSLYLIPSWATDTFILTAVVETQEGKKYSYRLEDESTLVQWLPMAFVPGGFMEVPLSVRKNIWKNLLMRMKQDGVFKSGSALAVSRQTEAGEKRP